MIPQATVDQILDTARIEEVVGEFVTLKRRGANFVACCPFHNEKTPSFYVSPSKGIYKCFGCGKAGSAVGFVMEHEHCSYTEALRFLASKYHIEIQEKEETAEEIASRQKRESLMLVMEFAQKFFVDSLKTQEGRSYGYAYYRSRGLEDETIERFGLGWAPKGRTALLDAALAAGYKTEYLLDAGLLVKYDDGRLVDKFHERVTFPIHSLSGRVVAFSCRTLRSDDSVAKYVNSPETELYHKSNILYGIYLAKSEISRRDKCYLLEGNVDVVSMSQLGIGNVVASCGTSLTIEQIRLIHKFTENVTIMYDGDKAGIKAALKGIGMVLREGLNVKVVLLPDGDDPDSFSRKHSLEEVEAFIEAHESDFINFKTDLLLDEAQGDPIRKANLINDIADTVAQIPDAVKRSVYVQTVARKFEIEPEILFDRITSQRQRMIAEERAAREREKRREGASYDYSAPAEYAPAEYVPAAEMNAPVVPAPVETYPIVAPVEKELLFFLLTHGSEPLVFETDSEFYCGEESPTVADFIISSLDQDGGCMLNPELQEVYGAYVNAYDSNMSQDDIVKSLLNSSNRALASVAAELSMEKYQITIDSFAKSLTTTSSWLATYVPRTILKYMDRKIENRLSQIRHSLPSAEGEAQLEMMQEMLKLQRMQKNINEKMKR